MALSKDKKSEVVNEVTELLANSKMTVFAQYAGTSVKSLQQLRSDASKNGTSIKVVKNRLFKKALLNSDSFKQVSTDLFTGQLIYAFNETDETAPAQDLAAFAKQQTQIKFVGGLSSEGELLDAEAVTYLASLPSKESLRAQLAATLASPMRNFAGTLQANISGLVQVINARAGQISK